MTHHPQNPLLSSAHFIIILKTHIAYGWGCYTGLAMMETAAVLVPLCLQQEVYFGLCFSPRYTDKDSGPPRHLHFSFVLGKSVEKVLVSAAYESF